MKLHPPPLCWGSEIKFQRETPWNLISDPDTRVSEHWENRRIYRRICEHKILQVLAISQKIRGLFPTLFSQNLPLKSAFWVQNPDTNFLWYFQKPVNFFIIIWKLKFTILCRCGCTAPEILPGCLLDIGFMDSFSFWRSFVMTPQCSLYLPTVKKVVRSSFCYWDIKGNTWRWER